MIHTYIFEEGLESEGSGNTRVPPSGVKLAGVEHDMETDGPDARDAHPRHICHRYVVQLCSCALLISE